MEVKTEDGGLFDAAGNGTKGMAIAGLVTGAAALLGGGLLGGFNMMNNQQKEGDEFVTQKQINALQAYDTIQAELEKEKAERYTDQAVIAQAEKESASDAKLAKDMLDIGVGVATMSANIQADREKATLREQILNMKIEALDNKLTGAIALEAERRSAGDQNLFGYVNATFVPGKLYLASTSVTPTPMPEFNSWTSPTTTTTTA